VLRDTAYRYEILANGGNAASPFTDNLRALADALDAQDAVTWEDRVERAAETAYTALWENLVAEVVHNWATALPNTKRTYRTNAGLHLRAAFPELAPSGD
jgi:hypothetical protein